MSRAKAPWKMISWRNEKKQGIGLESERKDAQGKEKIWRRAAHP